MKNQKLSIAILLALFCFGLNDAGSQTSGKRSIGDLKSSGQHRRSGLLPARLERVYENVRRRVERGELPGAVVLLAHKGNIVGLEPIGLADLESGIPMQDNSIFRLASATKIITSVALLTLYEEGKLGLMDAVSDHLPEFKTLSVYGSGDKTQPAKRKLRIQDLLRHTSGYSYGYADPQQTAYRNAGILRSGARLDWSHNMTLDEWIARLATIPLAEEPGTKFSYGLSSDILGLLIERLSGKSLDRFMHDSIFKPLRMNSTGFVVPADQLSRLTTIYQIEDRKMTALDRAQSSRLRSRPKALSGGGGWDDLGNGGLVSTAPDFFRFLQMLLNGGTLDGVRILGRKTVELMMQNHLSGLSSIDSIWPGVGFGFGFAVLYDIARYGEVGSPGTIWWAGSTNVHYWVDPREELVGVLMVQVRPFPYLDLMDDVRNMSFHALE